MWPVSNTMQGSTLVLTTATFTERQSVCHGPWPTFSSHGNRVKVRTVSIGHVFVQLMGIRFRDKSKHSSLKEEIEEQSTALYATARLWDDGIVKPVDTRDTVGLALALAARERQGSGKSGRSATTWDGDGKGYGVFRM